jgi:hypothetical protein
MSSDLVISHVDIDGMVAAAGLLRTLPDDTGLRLTSYRLLPEYLGRLKDVTNAPRRAWIADLGVDPEGATEALEAMDALIARGTRFYWFDHHPWDGDVAEQVKARAEAFHLAEGLGRPAALVVCDAVHPGEAFARLAREILIARGRTSDPMAWSWFRCLACLQVERDWPSIHRAVRRLSRMEALEADELCRIDDMPTATEATVVGDKMRVGITATGTRYAMLDLRDQHVRRNAVGEVCRSHDLDMVITVPSDYELVVDGLGPRADMGRLAELDRLEQVAQVCPHINPVSIELNGRRSGLPHEEVVGQVLGWIEREM